MKTPSSPSDTLSYQCLDLASRPLLARFYREHGWKMRGAKQTFAWVVRDPTQQLIAGLCLTAIEQGHWLTGLMVAPERRRQGVASQFLQHIREQLTGPIWLFCHPTLEGFYQTLDYRLCSELPPVLADKLLRYQRSKSLIAMCHSGL